MASSQDLRAILAELEADYQALQDNSKLVEETLYGDALVLIPNLVSALAAENASATSATQEKARLAVEEWIPRHCSAKEAVLAIHVLLGHLGGEEADEEIVDEAEDDDEEADLTEPVATRPDSGMEARKLVALVTLLSNVIVNIRTVNPARFLQESLAAVRIALEAVTPALLFASEDDGEMGTSEASHEVENERERSALGLLIVLERATREWMPCTSPENKDLVVQALTEALPPVSLLLDSNLSGHLVRAEMPRYGRSRGANEAPELATTELGRLLVAFRRRLSMTPAFIYTTLAAAPRGTSVSPLMVTLAYFLALEPTPKESESFLDDARSAMDALKELLPRWRVLLEASSARSSGSNRAPPGLDETLFVLLWLVIKSRNEGLRFSDDESFFLLVSILSSFTPLCASPSLRFAAYKTLSMVLLDLAPSEQVRWIAMQDLVEDCPWASMRAAAVGILKDWVIRALDGVAPGGGEKSYLCTERGFNEVAGTVWAKVDGSVVRGEQQEAEEEATVLTEKLSLYYLWLARDSESKTLIRSPQALARVEGDFLAPLRSTLASASSMPTNGPHDHGHAQPAMNFTMLEIGMKRVDDFIGQIATA